MPHTSLGLCLGFLAAACALPLAVSAQETDIVGSWSLESWTLANGRPRCSEEEGGVSGQLETTVSCSLLRALGNSLGCGTADTWNDRRA